MTHLQAPSLTDVEDWVKPPETVQALALFPEPDRFGTLDIFDCLTD
jgi:hypothetical protein